MLLPDGRQRLQVRLYERRRDNDKLGPWLYRIGAPIWEYDGEGDVSAMEFRTWVTADQLEPIEGVDLSVVPTYRVVHEPPPSRWGWVQRPKPGGRGFTLHDHYCELAADGGAELGIEEALDAMLRPGAEACTRCDAAAVLVPMLQLGQGYM
ncbi:DUF6233 domain-containing protein [Streptomyces goshikiensis]|uniref:DUF6233 domain-containing protein n=1 Tax=Streptomyces goshikiensis TaxID=1942 RepID=UPI003662A17A